MKAINSAIIVIFTFSVVFLSSCAIDSKRFDASDFDAKIQPVESDIVVFPKTPRVKEYSAQTFEFSGNYAKAMAKINERKEKERILAREKYEQRLAERKAAQAIKAAEAKERKAVNRYDSDSRVQPCWWTFYYGPDTGFRRYLRQYGSYRYYAGAPNNLTQDSAKRTRTTFPGGINYPTRSPNAPSKWTAAPGSTERPYPTYR